MSHPPETGLSSRELAERCFELESNLDEEQGFTKAVALIDAWVRVREAEAVRNEAKACHDWYYAESIQRQAHNCTWEDTFTGPPCAHLASANTALATASKQLKGGTHDQAEAPSAAASANSEQFNQGGVK